MWGHRDKLVVCKPEPPSPTSCPQSCEMRSLLLQPSVVLGQQRGPRHTAIFSLCLRFVFQAIWWSSTNASRII